MSRSSIQVSISDETPTSVRSHGCAAGGQAGEHRGDAAGPSGSRSAAAASPARRPRCRPSMKLLIGSTITTAGLELVDLLVHRARGASPGRDGVGRDGLDTSAAPSSRHGSRSMPIERMLRTICCGDSSKAKYRQRSPRAQAASAKCAARLRLAGAGGAGDQNRCSRGRSPCRRASRRAAARPWRCARRCAGWSRPSDVTGRTEMPSSSMRNGYSLVPCVVPRYLTTRSRRVETCSVTR